MNQLSSVRAEQEITFLGAVPVDRMAWRVIAPGEHYVPNKKIACLVFDSQPPMRGTRRGRGERRPENLNGRTVGRMTVVGYWGPKVAPNGYFRGGAANQVWVCRCSCGIHVTRTAKTIKAARDSDDCCEYCRHLKYMKRNEEFRRLGYNLDQRAAA